MLNDDSLMASSRPKNQVHVSGELKSNRLPSVLSIVICLIVTVLSLTLDCINTVLSISESLASIIFETCSEICGIHPCGTYKAENSAILILGAQEGLGRSAALKFSELGYTVFALCPNRYHEQPPEVSGVPLRKTSDPFALLYIWHNRKERSQSLPWGLVAPISLDMWSSSQRKRAHETIKAYCHHHSLHLVALVVSSITENPSFSSFSVSTLSMPDKHAHGGSSDRFSHEDVWRERIVSELTEPILMANDYAWMLKEASGRVLIISTYSQGWLIRSIPLSLIRKILNFLSYVAALSSTFPMEEARRIVAEDLSGSMNPLGVRVSSIVTGPVATISRECISGAPVTDRRDASDVDAGSNMTSCRRTLYETVDKAKLRDCMFQIAQRFTVHDDVILSVLQGIIASREQQSNSLYAALARTMTRSAALYFSRPVRLFRPTKMSGWRSLRGLAEQEGASLSPSFLSQLVKTQGFMVIPKHFFPPLLVNALLGTVLWTTYTETSSALEPYLSTHPICLSMLSGAAAGGMQAIVAAPAENVRLAIEGGSIRGGGWSHAWKEVFRGTTSPNLHTRQESMEEIREVRNWMREVRELAGRGWDGWGWGLAKDVCGFAVFFSVFEVTRRVATTLKAASQNVVQYYRFGEDRGRSVRRHVPRVINGLTLVTGGVLAGLAYELLSRPWDVARRTVYLERVHSSATHSPRHSAVTVLAQKARDDGLLFFFQNPTPIHHHQITDAGKRRLHAALRTLARVGPWGVGFLVWEAFGPGIS
ncbi:hypothetical protein EW146_g965 [Bondarzewia mesenterica]|uniref:Uncharacterized protein n=1 Tax=Bondarzewia mesenterica TaxID=1095465 RepID=A0A4S4M554_9AGAM|nr:hypothetical protein EW146_g965 [Bondarzewia mesenterica]